MTAKKFEIIKCPRCDYEYLPSEIFVPKNFFGLPTSIERDFSGRIMEFSGNSLDLEETYTCDNCNTTFHIGTKISFNTCLEKVENIDEEYISDINKPDLFN